MRTFFKIIGYLLIFFILTILTQIGGVLFLFVICIYPKIQSYFSSKSPNLLQKAASFLILYLFTTFFILPHLAFLSNRVPLPYFSTNQIPIKPANLLTCLFNRHYVHPELLTLTEETALKISQKYPGTKLLYLDANFPFWDNFPLLPHLSHDDGEKLDLSFLYTDAQTGGYLNERTSFTGYGYCEKPQKGEVNQAQICAKKGYWQYSLLEKMVNQRNNPNFEFDKKRNKDLLQFFATNKKTGKILLEPHLKQRLGLSNYRKVRFHGCHAVRHDDHIHIQL